MPKDVEGRRGSYAKGIAKREEILTRALDVVAREGYHGASVKELAAAVGLSQAGLLHYFDSKEELFTAILQKRDEIDTAQLGPDARSDWRAADLAEIRDGYLRVIRHNSEVPGVVELFSRMAVEAAEPRHPAHAFFTERGAALREIFADVFARRQQAEAAPDDIDPETAARIFQAVADGLQLQWLLEPDIDMAAIVDTLFTVFASRARV